MNLAAQIFQHCEGTCKSRALLPETQLAEKQFAPIIIQLQCVAWCYLDDPKNVKTKKIGLFRSIHPFLGLRLGDNAFFQSWRELLGHLDVLAVCN